MYIASEQLLCLYHVPSHPSTYTDSTHIRWSHNSFFSLSHPHVLYFHPPLRPPPSNHDHTQKFVNSLTSNTWTSPPTVSAVSPSPSNSWRLYRPSSLITTPWSLHPHRFVRCLMFSIGTIVYIHDISGATEVSGLGFNILILHVVGMYM